MPENEIVKNQTGLEDGNDAGDRKLRSDVSRREFLQKSMMVTSSLALTAMLPAFTKGHLSEVSAPATTCQPGQPLMKVMEISAKRADPKAPGTLQAVIKIINENKQYLAASAAGGGKTTCASGQMRYFSGYDKGDPGTVWPNSFPEMVGGPAPGPTLRCRIGDTVQITLLNHVRVSDFANSLDVAEKGGGCDISMSVGPDGKAVNTYPGNPSFETPPDCFHGSSSTNLHFHGTHVSPNSLADYVLANTRPSPREANGNPTVDEKYVEADFNEIFKMCSEGHMPELWGQFPKTWQEKQKELLEKYDLTAPWKGVNGPVDGKPALPLSERLWPKNQAAIDSCTWPQYYIGAYPNCFTLPVWIKDDPKSPVMGQAPGTHWYHSHKHGSTALNLANGMAGALIIEGEYDEKLQPFFTKQVVLVIQQFGTQLNLMRNGINDQGQANKNIGTDLVFVNGQYTPVLEMNPNEMQLWRFVNACHRAQIPLSAPAPLKWVQTAQDGVQLHQDNYNPGVTNASISIPAATTSAGKIGGTLAAGNRVDFLVQAPSTAGGPYPVNFGNKTLFQVVVKQDPKAPVIKNPMPFPTNTEFPMIPGFLEGIDPNKVTVRRALHFASNPAKNRSTQGPSFAPPIHTIDGKQFDNTIDQSMVLGATEEWTMYNDSPGAAHPFHIHINPFQVTEILNPAVSKNPVILKPPYVWFDDFAIPPAAVPPDGDGKTQVSGYFKMITRFVDFPGVYVLHCHILGHEDRGMMQLVQVVSNTTHMEHN
ncbi:MAG TPA: multicopper oxidase domain-containing protein [Pyrinomonadaceae bacterium]|nr:multicopper oxidase domain-containing protein [Pyrinomonadaceae bacterium]